jgi:hypothetical protein
MGVRLTEPGLSMMAVQQEESRGWRVGNNARRLMFDEHIGEIGTHD